MLQYVSENLWLFWVLTAILYVVGYNLGGIGRIRSWKPPLKAAVAFSALAELALVVAQFDWITVDEADGIATVFFVLFGLLSSYAFRHGMRGNPQGFLKYATRDKPRAELITREAQDAYVNANKGATYVCPNCEVEVKGDAWTCHRCDADFRSDHMWKPRVKGLGSTPRRRDYKGPGRFS